jgi:hypothetical protein
MLNPIPAPSVDALASAIRPCAEIVSQSPHLGGLWEELFPGTRPPTLDDWACSERRAVLDAIVADAYGLTLEETAAVLCAFPNLDRSQPMLPGEPKSFVTRDLALKAFCTHTGSSQPNIAKLMREIASGLPDPRTEFQDLDARLHAYAKIGAVPYRPTPKGARIPTDPSLLDDVFATLSDDPQSSDEIADALGEDAELVNKILKNLKKSGEVYAEGRGKKARYYVVGDD